MLKDLHILHRRKPEHFASDAHPLVWETCLRSLAFVTNPETAQNSQVYSGVEAYQFLLEVICGLHSPVVGETEVFGQFKNFAGLWQKHEPQRVALIQRLFAEAKELRSKHLTKIGTQSYGSWIRRKIKSKQVHILGGGNLAQEILPYLVKMSDHVAVHVRTPSKLKMSQPSVKVHPLESQNFDQGALIIAAPVSAGEIAKWLKGNHPHEIFDLRDNSHQDRVELGVGRHHLLTDVFQEIEKTKAQLEPVVALLKNEIRARGLKLASQIVVRPQGWDDICA